MDKIEFYRILDIDRPVDFKFYENLASLMEENAYIDENLLIDLIRNIDKETLAELTEAYFDEFLRVIPDEYTDLYITVETARRALTGALAEEMTDEEVRSYAGLIGKFRKWYSLDSLVADRLAGEKISVRDARYNFIAAGLLGTELDYNFEEALGFDSEGYTVRLADIIDAEIAGADEDTEENTDEA